MKHVLDEDDDEGKVEVSNLFNLSELELGCIERHLNSFYRAV